MAKHTSEMPESQYCIILIFICGVFKKTKKKTNLYQFLHHLLAEPCKFTAQKIFKICGKGRGTKLSQRKESMYKNVQIQKRTKTQVTNHVSLLCVLFNVKTIKTHFFSKCFHNLFYVSYTTYYMQSYCFHM